MLRSDGGDRPHFFIRFIMVLLLVILIFAAVVFTYLWSKLDLITYADEVESTTPSLNPEAAATEFADYEDYTVSIDDLDIVESVTVPSDTDIMGESDVLNILLIGTDERTTEYNVNARADSMILVSIHKGNNTVRLVSLERGIGVPILEGEHEGEFDLLTHIFRWGGADLLVKTVEHCFKVDVDHYVRLNFASVTQIVDAVGGVDVELTKEEVNYLGLFIDLHSSTGKQEPLKVGINHLDGGNALAFARLREIDSDWQRVGRQRRVILAVVDALKGSTLLELNTLADHVLPLIQTNLSKIEIAELLLYAPNFLTSEFDQMTIPKKGTYGGMKIRNGGGAFAVDYEINNDLLYRFFYEGVSSEELLAE